MARSTNMDVIGDKVIAMLSRKNEARERGLPLSRDAIRHCANAIRAIHRKEFERAEVLLQGAHIRIEEMKQALSQHPDLRYGSFVYDAEKEYSEAQATMALVRGDPIPDPDDIGVDYAAYVNGLGEAIGEMRRHLLDELRRGDPGRIEELMAAVDDIYNLLISVDFPDAITAGLRRTTDIARSVLEKTRGDITLTFQQRSLERRLKEIEVGLSRLVLPSALPVTPAAAPAEVPVAKAPVRRRRTTRVVAAAADEALPPAPAPPVFEVAPVAPQVPPAEMPLPPLEPAAPARRRWQRRRIPTAAPIEAVAAPQPAPLPVEVPVAPVAGVAAVGVEGPPKRHRRRRRRHSPLVPGVVPAPAAVAPAPAPAPAEAPAAPAIAETTEAAPKRHRRRRRRRSPVVLPGAEPAPAIGLAPPISEPAPVATVAAPPVADVPHRRRRRRRRPAPASQMGEVAPLGLSPPPDPAADGGPFPEPW